MNKKGFFMGIIVIGIIFIIGFFWFAMQSGLIKRDDDNNNLHDILEEELENYMESSCVPKTCCHATECVMQSEAPVCSDVMCTLDCQPGTMDCGAGKCVWKDGNCEVEWNE